MKKQRVVVINQFAMPRTHWGLTRNAELFARLGNYDPVIFAGNVDHYAQKRMTTTDPLFVLCTVPLYRGRSFWRILGWAVFATKAVWFTLRQRTVTVVYASSPHLLAGVAGLIAARVRRVPFVLEVRDLWPESIVAAGMLRRSSKLHRGLIALERGLYERASAIVVVTNGWEEHFAALGIDSKKLHVIPNGVDIGEFTVSQSRSELRRAFGLDAADIVAVYAGAHGPANGLDQLIDAGACMPALKIVLVGAGSEKSRLRQRAETESLTNIAFMDPVPRRDLAGIFCAADIGVHVLAPWEVMNSGLSPNKIFDYMAAGLPVVSNCVEGLRGVITGDECGPLGGPEDIAKCLRMAAEATPDQRHAWGSAGKCIVRARYSREVAATALTRVLDDVSRRAL